MTNKKPVLITLVILVCLFMGGAFFYKQNQSQTQTTTSTQGESLLIRSHSPKFGKNQNNITLVEFSDPECNACAIFHPTVNKIIDEYDNEIQLVVRYLDNHKNSKFVIKILESARKQNKLKESLNIVYFYQHIWGDPNNPRPQLLWDYLKEVDDLNITQLRKDFDTINIDEMLSIDRADSNKLGIRGTPTFFVNGKKLEDFSLQGLEDLVESEIYK